jgi:hypothetical protein
MVKKIWNKFLEVIKCEWVRVEHVLLILTFVCTAVIAVANWVTYSAMQKDFKARTRPYLAIDFHHKELEVYLQNYGQVPAFDASICQFNLHNGRWDPAGGVSSLVIMPTEKHEVRYEDPEYAATGHTSMIKFESTYKGSDKSLIYSTTVYFNLEYKKDKHGMLAVYKQQQEYAD